MFTVFPATDEDIKFVNYKRDRRITPRISKYNSLNQVNVFYKDKRFSTSTEKKPANEYKDLYREITYYYTKEKFPSIQRRMKIVDIKIVTLDPLENAIKDVEDKVREITDSVISHYKDIKPDSNELSMQLNGTLDAAVNGGITKYIEAFFNDEYINNADEKQKRNLARFQSCLRDQLAILKEGLQVWRQHTKNVRLADHLDGMHKKLADQLQKIFEMKFA